MNAQAPIRMVCRPAVAAGFRLTGLAPIEEPEARAAARRLAAELAEARNLPAVLLVEEAIYAALDDAARRSLSRHPLPLVVPFPGPAWAEREEAPDAFIAELLRQAIGYRVRLG
jgi:vacuolar-type H+-ATPase subunit F/Vma7